MGQSTESGIYNTVIIPRHCVVQQNAPRLSATLISQLSLVLDFDTKSLRYIIPRLFGSTVTVFSSDPYRFMAEIVPRSGFYSYPPVGQLYKILVYGMCIIGYFPCISVGPKLLTTRF